MLASVLTVGSGLNYILEHPFILLAVAIWIFIWKGIALWKAARLYHRWWFGILLVLNSFGIVEIAYIFIVARAAEESLKTGTDDANSVSS